MTMTLLPFGFIRRIAVCFWCGDSRAGASNAMATLASLGTAGDHWNGEEQRFARDGMPYTFLQFIEYYGERGNARWQEAPIATAGGAPQPAAAAMTYCNEINELDEDPCGGAAASSTAAQKATSTRAERF